MGADGVHVGQTDMPAREARRLLPKDSILGVSVSNIDQARTVLQDSVADYIGIGPIWYTASKTLTTDLLGPRGASEILDEIPKSSIRTVAIG